MDATQEPILKCMNATQISKIPEEEKETPRQSGRKIMATKGSNNEKVFEDATTVANEFFWSYADEPHASRRRQILSCYPEIRALFGPDPWSLLKITLVVYLQLVTAVYLYKSGWKKILMVAYFFGSILSHNLFFAIHELSHNLAFSNPTHNRLLGMFTNLPMLIPISVTFQKYHLEHHCYQGVDGTDTDIPTLMEARLVKNVTTKCIWVLFQIFIYAIRPLFINPKRLGKWEFMNIIIQTMFDAYIIYFWGWRSLSYLILSISFGGGMHPISGHLISEHYVFNRIKGQETYSYYGPLNIMAWHVGFHNEHHDFPRIPGSKLHKLREIAPEYYENLESYNSWSQVIYTYIVDKSMGPSSRMKRRLSTKNK